jgi:hypothetical protein
MTSSLVAIISFENYYMLNPDPLSLPLVLNAAFITYLVLVIGSSMLWYRLSFCHVKRADFGWSKYTSVVHVSGETFLISCCNENYKSLIANQVKCKINRAYLDL